MDIKPLNILVGYDYYYKIADFGLSEKVADNGTVKSSRGTPQYCHPLLFEALKWKELWPEKQQNQRAFPATVELWSIGILLYEVSTAKLPFNANSVHSMFRIMETKPMNAICAREDENGQVEFLEDIEGCLADKNFVAHSKPLIRSLLQVVNFYSLFYFSFFLFIFYV